MPFIRDVGTLAPKLMGVLLSEFLAPLPDCFVGDFDPAIQHHLLDVPVAQGECVVQPDTVTNNFARKSMTGVHEQAGEITVEPVRLFYIRVKLTIPFKTIGISRLVE